MHWIRRHPRGRPPHSDILTPAEWRVLEHVRQGKSNADIASELGVSINTVRTHVSSMLAKLEVPDRQALAAWDGRPAEVTTGAERRFPLALPVAGWLSGKAVAVGGGVAAVIVVAVVAVVTLPLALDEGAESARGAQIPLVDGLPEGAVGPLLIYMHQVGSEDRDGREWATLEIVAYDVGRDERTSFAISEQVRSPTSARVANREVIVNYGHEIVAYRLDGTLDRVIYSMPGDWRGATAEVALPFAISPDGARIAFADHFVPDVGWRLYIADLATGTIEVEIDEADLGGEAQETRGFMAPLEWMREGEGLLVQWLTYSEGWSAGVLRLGPPLEYSSLPSATASRIDPSHQYMARMERSPDSPLSGCVIPAGEGIGIIPLAEPGSVTTISRDGRALTPLEWAPDGSALLYHLRPVPDDDPCEAWRFEPELWLYELDSGEHTQVDSLVDLRRRWEGERAITFECGGDAFAGFRPGTSRQLEGPGRECGDAPITIELGGQPLDSIPPAGTVRSSQRLQPTILGFIEVD